MTTWREEIIEAMGKEETLDDVEYITLSEKELDREFDDNYGLKEGEPFLLWTKNRVYFPVCYDGSEWVESVPRNPCEEKREHIGGG